MSEHYSSEEKLINALVDKEIEVANEKLRNQSLLSKISELEKELNSLSKQKEESSTKKDGSLDDLQKRLHELSSSCGFINHDSDSARSEGRRQRGCNNRGRGGQRYNYKRSQSAGRNSQPMQNSNQYGNKSFHDSEAGPDSWYFVNREELPNPNDFNNQAGQHSYRNNFGNPSGQTRGRNNFSKMSGQTRAFNRSNNNQLGQTGWKNANPSGQTNRRSNFNPSGQTRNWNNPNPSAQTDRRNNFNSSEETNSYDNTSNKSGHNTKNSDNMPGQTRKNVNRAGQTNIGNFNPSVESNSRDNTFYQPVHSNTKNSVNMLGQARNNPNPPGQTNTRNNFNPSVESNSRDNTFYQPVHSYTKSSGNMLGQARNNPNPPGQTNTRNNINLSGQTTSWDSSGNNTFRTNSNTSGQTSSRNNFSSGIHGFERVERESRIVYPQNSSAGKNKKEDCVIL